MAIYYDSLALLAIQFNAIRQQEDIARFQKAVTNAYWKINQEKDKWRTTADLLSQN